MTQEDVTVNENTAPSEVVNADVNGSSEPQISQKFPESHSSDERESYFPQAFSRPCIFVKPGFAGFEIPLIIPRPGFSELLEFHYLRLARIRYQVEYYFGDKNIIRDRYLQEQMTVDRYVPISVILEFPRMKQLCASADLVVQACCNSSVVELDVTGGLIRRRNPFLLRNSVFGESKCKASLYSINLAVSVSSPTPMCVSNVPVHPPYCQAVPVCSSSRTSAPLSVSVSSDANHSVSCVDSVLGGLVTSTVVSSSATKTRKSNDAAWRKVEKKQRGARTRNTIPSPQSTLGSRSVSSVVHSVP
ncbi:unnamed protein product [Echinostoma caproni]|uniref:HTH La-type RNA-binding domain-containing protein n=1 Tax=Echinostoma caproni TaxID=27848 RepID=A0A3P8GIK0_9TREM|nr:unnamed protein product [Echinostoma caproni]